MKKNSGLKFKTDRLSAEFIAKNGETCAATVITNRQKLFYTIATLLLMLLLCYRWDIFLFVITAVLAILYLVSAFFRLIAAVAGRFFRYEKVALTDDKLPMYTILLPMYKESNIAKQLTSRIMALDYPKDKLDVKILLEADDIDTQKAMAELNLPNCFEVLVMDAVLPKTKPRACNYGLERAKGEFCVIYDAEDRPEPDQLKKVVGMFSADKDGLTACVQARLNYHNSRQNILTRLFTIEYSTHFDLILPGMQIFNFPLPLGGTSNHFRSSILRDIGGWDPFNVTEDCDLGIRIYENDYRTMLVDSTTWEEANCELGNWIRQRSRWVKGFFQTHFVHYRFWPKTIKRLGFWGALGGFFAVGGSSMMLLCNIIFFALTLFYVSLLGIGVWQGVPIWNQIVAPNSYLASDYGIEFLGIYWKAWPLIYYGAQESVVFSSLSLIFASVSLLLFLANILFVAIGILGCIERRYWHLIAFTPLLIIYWLIMSVAAWKGFLQLFYKPFYWEKTKHGLNKTQ